MPNTPQTDVFQAIKDERAYQAKRWGLRLVDGTFLEVKHSVGEWLVFMHNHLQEAMHKITREPTAEGALASLQQVTALGIAALEEHGVATRKPAPAVNIRDGKTAA